MISLHQFKNGSYTLKDGEGDQLMHSSIGAAIEAERLYGIPGREHLKSLSMNANGCATVWDVGFGTGSNAIALFDAFMIAEKEHDTDEPIQKLSIESFELFPETLSVTLENIQQFPALLPYQINLVDLLEHGKSTGVVGPHQIPFEWRLIFGDFRETIQNGNPPNLVFYDFYSPKSNSALWDTTVFQSIHEKTRIFDENFSFKLLTYSSATWVRAHLLAAGFYIGEGTTTELKNETTEATLNYESLSKPVSRQWKEKLFLSASPEMNDEIRKKASEHPQWNT